jgi:hypothetical protein
LMKCDSTSNNIRRTLSTYSDRWVSSTHHHHRISDLAWERTPHDKISILLSFL